MGSGDVKLAESVGIIFNTRIVRGKADGKSGQVSDKKKSELPMWKAPELMIVSYVTRSSP